MAQEELQSTETEEPVIPSKEELLGTVEKVASEDTGEAEDYSKVEAEAIEHGWNPEGVEGKLNLSAEEFMDRQKLYDDIRGLKKQNRKLQDGIEAMKEFQTKLRQTERDKLLKELKDAKVAALKEEDYDTVVQIDDKIAETQVAADPQPNKIFEDWVDNNEWYHQDSEMRQYADTIGAGYFQQNPTRNVTDVYKYVGEEVKKRFPDKFGNPNREKSSPVEGAGKGRSRTSKQHSVSELPETDREIMRTIVRSGAMTEAEYLKEYFS